MENEKPKLEKYQKILLGFSWFFLVVAGALLVWDIVHFEEGGLHRMWLPFSLSNILKYCAKWKQNPKTNTIFIVSWCIIFLLTLMLWIISLFT